MCCDGRADGRAAAHRRDRGNGGAEGESVVRAWAWLALAALAAGGAVYVGGAAWGGVLAAVVVIIVLLCAGAWSRGAPPVARTMVGWARRWPTVTLYGLGTALCMAAFGAWLHCVDVELEEGWCTEGASKARSLLGNEDFEPARVHLARAHRVCGAAKRIELDALEMQRQAAEAVANACKQREVTERQAAADRAARDAFPERVPALREGLMRAAALLANDDHAGAAVELVRVHAAVDDFLGTAVEKSDEWAALRAEARDLRLRLKPYFDEIEAALVHIEEEFAAQDEQERRDDVRITREGHVAARTREKLDQALRYAAADAGGLGLLLERDPDVFLLEDGRRVVVVEQAGVGLVRVRAKGSLDELWMAEQALRAP